MYKLKRTVCVSGYGDLYRLLLESDDLTQIVRTIKELVEDGTPLETLSVTKDMAFTFESTILFTSEEDTYEEAGNDCESSEDTKS